MTDIHSAIVATVVLLAVAALGGIVAIYENLRLLLLGILQTPTPLWSSILLVLLSCLLVYLKIRGSLLRSNTPVDYTKQLDEEDIRVLLHIAETENPLVDKDDRIISEYIISVRLKLSPQQTKHHLEKLYKASCTRYDPYGELRGLTAFGREFLKEKNLLP